MSVNILKLIFYAYSYLPVLCFIGFRNYKSWFCWWHNSQTLFCKL